MEVLVAQSCLSLCDPVYCSLPGFSVHGILQERILEWLAIPFSGDLANPGIKPGSPTLQADSSPSEYHRNLYIPQSIFPVPWTPSQKRHMSVLSAWVLRPQRGTGTNLPHGFVDASMKVDFHILQTWLHLPCQSRLTEALPE